MCSKWISNGFLEGQGDELPSVYSMLHDSDIHLFAASPAK